jgi:hypothetical protein
LKLFLDCKNISLLEPLPGLTDAKYIMASNGSYNNERQGAGDATEYATDPASGSFFHSDYKK